MSNFLYSMPSTPVLYSMPPTCVLYSMPPTFFSVQFITYLCSVQYATYLCSVKMRPTKWAIIMVVALCQERLYTPVLYPHVNCVRVDGDKLSVMSENFNLCHNMS